MISPVIVERYKQIILNFIAQCVCSVTGNTASFQVAIQGSNPCIRTNILRKALFDKTRLA